MRQKIGIVGSGHVGSEVANEIVRMDIGDCVILDIRADRAKATALDLTHSSPIRHSSATVVDGGDFDALCGCSVVVYAAGVARSQGMSREELLETNLAIARGIVPELLRVCPGAIWIVVTNPLDAITYGVWKLSGRDSRSILGMAGVLDSARFCSLIAHELNTSPDDVCAIVLGSHGDLMVPLGRFASISGIPAVDLIDPGSMSRIVEGTKRAGSELVSLLHSGSAFYAAGAATARVVDSILNDRRRVLCLSAMCTGEYGIDQVFVGVPTVVGTGGVEAIIELRLTEVELAALRTSAAHLRTLQEQVNTLLG